MSRLEEIRRWVSGFKDWSPSYPDDTRYLLDLVDRAKPHMECIRDDGDLEPGDLWLVQQWLDEVRGEGEKTSG